MGPRLRVRPGLGARLALSLKPCAWLLVAALLLGGAWAFPSQPEARQVRLQGTRNTRELGGIPLRVGSVRKGKIYRSGALCFATRSDAQVLHQSGIRTLVELRLASEIAKDGADKPYLLEGLTLVHWPMGHGGDVRGREAYFAYLRDNRPLVRDFFQLLGRAESYPLLFHCSAGKDRTGILTALLLEWLGASREVILDDYLHSRRITSRLKVEEDWIAAVFETVDTAGGIEPYLLGLGLTAEELVSVREHLIEQP